MVLMARRGNCSRQKIWTSATVIPTPCFGMASWSTYTTTTGRMIFRTTLVVLRAYHSKRPAQIQDASTFREGDRLKDLLCFAALEPYPKKNKCRAVGLHTCKYFPPIREVLSASVFILTRKCSAKTFSSAFSQNPVVYHASFLQNFGFWVYRCDKQFPYLNSKTEELWIKQVTTMSELPK